MGVHRASKVGNRASEVTGFTEGSLGRVKVNDCHGGSRLVLTYELMEVERMVEND